jgi:putative intracellular protease/amidase
MALPATSWGLTPWFRRRRGRQAARHGTQRTTEREKVAVLAAAMFEQVELTEPWKALEEAGAELELASLEEGEIHGFDHYDRAGSFKVDKTGLRGVGGRLRRAGRPGRRRESGPAAHERGGDGRSCVRSGIPACRWA